jgi:microcystin-dependent protein
MKLPALPVSDPLATMNFERLAAVAPDPGDLKMTARATAPAGWLLCDGAAISRTEYAILYAAIGTTYGVGNGTTTFNIPNFLGRFPMGADPGNASTATGHTAHTLGAAGGEETHVLSAANMPAHTHPPGSGTKFFDWDTPAGNTTFGAGGNTPSLAATTGSAGGGGAHNNLPPYVTVNWLVKT